MTDARALLAAGRPFSARRAVQGSLASADARERHAIRRLLEELDRHLEPRIGRCWFPVDTAVGWAQAGLVRVDVHLTSLRGDATVLAAFAPALAAGAALASRPPEGLRVELWPAETPGCLVGASFELAVAIATWSRLTQTQLPHVALSGMLDAGQIRTPGALGPKAAAVQVEWGPDSCLVTGPTDAPGWLGAATLEEAVDLIPGLEARPTPLREALHDLTVHGRHQRFTHVAALAERLLEDGEAILDEDELFEVAIARAHALAHLGRTTEALQTWERAARWASFVPANARAESAAILGILLLDAGLIEQAWQTVVNQLNTPSNSTSRAARWARAQLEGTAARIASARGDHRAARRHGRHALALTRPDQRARNLHDLALWCLRAGEPEFLEQAEGHLDEAEAALTEAERVDRTGAHVTAQFVALTRARLTLARGDLAGARGIIKTLEPTMPALWVGAAELQVQLGDTDPIWLRRLDAMPALQPGAPPTILSRLRARIELRRRTPDLSQVEGWLGVAVADPNSVLADLDQSLPY